MHPSPSAFPPDIHTHNLDAAPGSAVVNMPLAWLDDTSAAALRPGVTYSVGLHPWWTAEADRLDARLEAVAALAAHPQVAFIGECGIDRLRGADIALQQRVFLHQAALAHRLHKPLIIHCVRAYDLLLHWRRHATPLPPQPWVVHGFRGGVATAQQLLAAGFALSFGRRYVAASYDATPAERRYRESDEDY